MDHAVIIHLELSDDKFGTENDRERISMLEDNIAEAFSNSGFGELDGDEFGEGECVIYTYGSDADALYSLVEPLLVADDGEHKGYAIKRYGEPDDPNAREIRMTW